MINPRGSRLASCALPPCVPFAPRPILSESITPPTNSARLSPYPPLPTATNSTPLLRSFQNATTFILCPAAALRNHQLKLPLPILGCQLSENQKIKNSKLAISPHFGLNRTALKKGTWSNRNPPIGSPFIPDKNEHTRCVPASVLLHWQTTTGDLCTPKQTVQNSLTEELCLALSALPILL
jgi:hypothetical protein